MAWGFPAVTLIKVTPGSRTPGQATGGVNATSASHSAKGIQESYRDNEIDSVAVKIGDRKVLILGATLPAGVVPVPGDRVISEGVTYSVVNVSRDPAAATYTLQARGS